MITNSWSRRQLTMITAAFQLAGVIIDVIRLHLAMIATTDYGRSANANSIADPNQIKMLVHERNIIIGLST